MSDGLKERLDAVLTAAWRLADAAWDLESAASWALEVARFAGTPGAEDEAERAVLAAGEVMGAAVAAEEAVKRAKGRRAGVTEEEGE